jgi:hypothetical protein
MGVDGLDPRSYGDKPKETTLPVTEAEAGHHYTDDSYYADSMEYPLVHGERAELEAQGKIASAVPSDEQLG